jgi:hypothetical protein
VADSVVVEVDGMIITAEVDGMEISTNLKIDLL